MDCEHTKVIIAISGKRKSGKDYLADSIVDGLGVHNCIIVRLALPVKQYFCAKYNMNLAKLLTASNYKETIRREMIQWDKEQRDQDPGIFCRTITSEAKLSEKKIWIVSDARRIYDIEYFKTYAIERDLKFHSIRLFADDETRRLRDWRFTKGIDDVTSECGLDYYNDWNFKFSNSKTDNIAKDIKQLCDIVSQYL